MKLDVGDLDPKAHRILIGVTAFVALIGLLLVFVGVRAQQRAVASGTWPSAPGVVTVSRVTERETRRESKKRVQHSYSADIRYEFTVGARRFAGSGVTLSDVYGSRGSAEVAVGRYPVGAEVTVRYDPDDPSVCCLVPGAAEGSGVFKAIGGVFFVLGGAGTFFLVTATTSRGRGPIA